MTGSLPQQCAATAGRGRRIGVDRSGEHGGDVVRAVQQRIRLLMCCSPTGEQPLPDRLGTQHLDGAVPRLRTHLPETVRDGLFGALDDPDATAVVARQDTRGTGRGVPAASATTQAVRYSPIGWYGTPVRVLVWPMTWST